MNTSKSSPFHKIFFTDLDGTLLDSDKKISSRTYAALQALVAAGYHLVLSSGRDLGSVKDVKKELALDFAGMFLIGYNGGQIFDCDREQIIHRVTMKIDHALQILTTSAQMGVYCHTYSDTHIYAPAQTKELEFYSRIIYTPVIVYDDITTALTFEPNKCLAIEHHDRRKLIALREELEKVLPNITYAYSTPYFIDMLPAESGKGAALHRICDYLGIAAADTVAAGDAENDLCMLEAAGYKIAMKNSADSLMEIADVVTEFSNDEDGLARVLEKLLWSK
ncbi:MAG: Cof-type HAD-IIB family hydrolase [Lachnospiraceae bacterium]|nr:Cof-type HAD-IIB family hydrolase [Lachnospiraceae bacterium]